MSTITARSRQKSDRRSQLLAAAEQLMADRGYLAGEWVRRGPGRFSYRSPE